MTDPTVVSERLAHIRDRIDAAGGDPGRVRVLPVTKGFGVDAATAVLAAGFRDIGENYAQELLGKAEALASADVSPRWHFLGRVQRNKVGRLAPVVACWQGVARAVEGAAIARHRPGATVLVELETTGNPGRNGCPASHVPGLVRALRDDGLTVEGLMTVAPPVHEAGPEGVRQSFRALRELADRLGLPVRSMGMTDDLELAVAEGSTMVRVGRALFGPRPLRAPGDGTSVIPGLG